MLLDNKDSFSIQFRTPDGTSHYINRNQPPREDADFVFHDSNGTMPLSLEEKVQILSRYIYALNNLQLSNNTQNDINNIFRRLEVLYSDIILTQNQLSNITDVKTEIDIQKADILSIIRESLKEMESMKGQMKLALLNMQELRKEVDRFHKNQQDSASLLINPSLRLTEMFEDDTMCSSDNGSQTQTNSDNEGQIHDNNERNR